MKALSNVANISSNKINDIRKTLIYTALYIVLYLPKEKMLIFLHNIFRRRFLLLMKIFFTIHPLTFRLWVTSAEQLLEISKLELSNEICMYIYGCVWKELMSQNPRLNLTCISLFFLSFKKA